MLSMWSSSTTQTTTIKAKKAQRLLWKMKNWRLADALWTFFSLFHGVINFMKLKPLSFCQSWVLRAWLTFCGFPHVSRPVPHLHEKLESRSCTEVSGYPEPKSPLYCFLFPPPPHFAQSSTVTEPLTFLIPHSLECCLLAALGYQVIQFTTWMGLIRIRRAQQLESLFAYPHQLHTRQNHRSCNYKLVWGYKQPKNASECTEFSTCVTGMNQMTVINSLSCSLCGVNCSYDHHNWVFCWNVCALVVSPRPKVCGTKSVFFAN